MCRFQEAEGDRMAWFGGGMHSSKERPESLL